MVLLLKCIKTNHEKTSDKPKLGDSLQNNWLPFSKVSRSKTEKTEEAPQIGGDDEDLTAKCNVGSGNRKKGPQWGKNRRSSNKVCRLVNTV